MILLRRRTLVAAGATVASGLPVRNSGAGDALRDAGALAPGPGVAVPALQFALPDGTVRHLADYAGKAVVLNLWATWCVPCVAEMPALDRLAAAVAGSGVVVLPLSSDRGGAAAVDRFYRSRAVTSLPVLLDPAGAAARALDVRGIPTTLLIDVHGQERARLEGAIDWASAASIAVVKRLAGG